MLISFPITFMSGGFTPKSIPNLAFWYDASNLNSITQVGGNVSQLNDLSGNGLNMVQATGSYQPVTGSATCNGNNVLSFTGITQGLINSTQNMSAFYNSSGSTMFFVESYTSGTIEGGIDLINTNRQHYEGGKRQDMPNDSTSSLSAASIPSGWVIKTGWRTSSSVGLYFNGVLEASASNTDTSSAGANAMVHWGSKGGGDNEGAIMLVAEHLHYARALSNTEIDTVGHYLAAKWGLTWTTI